MPLQLQFHLIKQTADSLSRYFNHLGAKIQKYIPVYPNKFCTYYWWQYCITQRASIVKTRYMTLCNSEEFWLVHTPRVMLHVQKRPRLGKTTNTFYCQEVFYDKYLDSGNVKQPFFTNAKNMEKTNVSRKFFFFSKINKRNCWILSKAKWRNGKALPKIVRRKHNSKEETDVIATAHDNWGIIIWWQFHINFFKRSSVYKAAFLSDHVLLLYFTHLSGFLPRFPDFWKKHRNWTSCSVSTGVCDSSSTDNQTYFLLHSFFAK